MRQFTGRAGRLRPLAFHAKLVYSIFLAFTIAGLLVTLWLTHEMVGIGLDGLGEYYAGEVSGAEPAASETATDEGPALDLPADLEPLASAEPLSRRHLLEVTHFHLFSMPVYLLILSHLYALTLASTLSKSLWITIGTASTVLHMVAPWAAAGSWPASSAIYATSGAAMLVSYLVMSFVPLVEMWSGGVQSSASDDASDDA